MRGLSLAPPQALPVFAPGVKPRTRTGWGTIMEIKRIRVPMSVWTGSLIASDWRKLTAPPAVPGTRLCC